MDRLKRSHFLEELTGRVHLTQYDAVSSINPDLARRTVEAQRVAGESARPVLAAANPSSPPVPVRG
jgi:hypothetical protein